ncbi:MAG TPA: hypothetical protein VF530_06845 [Planctomycetota bacterium]
MTLVTLEMGPLWKMELLRVVLEEHGVPGFVEDSNLKTIDPFLTGAMALDARLKVPGSALEAARAALAEARAGGLDEAEMARATGAELGAEEPAPPADAELEALARLGRRMRWAWVIPWMHPFLFVHGLAYLRELLRLRRAPPGNAMTLLSLGLAAAFWIVVVFEVGEILGQALGPAE